MITLHRLTIRDFKSLRAVDLVLPREASVLIEGFNESGKSSLFEAVIFALYGEPLVTEETGARGRGKAESAIRYGAGEARVRLECAIDDATRLVIERVLRRSGSTQATLEVWQGDACEAVRGQTEVNRRVVAEMGNLTREALLNSCFVEQKQLGKLEDLSREERQASLEHLLNLGRLGKVARQFTVTREEEAELEVAERRLRLAQHARAVATNVAETRAAERARAQLTLAQTLADEAAATAEVERWRAESAALTAARDRHAATIDRLRAVAAARAPLADLHDAQRRGAQLAERRAALAQDLARADEAAAEGLPRMRARASAIAAVAAHFAEVDDLQRLLADGTAEMEALSGQADQIAERQVQTDRLGSEIAEEDTTLAARAVALDDEAATHAQARAAAEERRRAIAALTESGAARERIRQRRDLAARDVVEWERRQAAAEAIQREAERHRATVVDLASQEATQTADLAALESQSRAVRERAALEQWLRSVDDAAHLAQLRSTQDEAQRQAAATRATVQGQGDQIARVRRGSVLSGAAASAALLAAVALVATGFPWGGALLVIALGAGVMTYRALRRASTLGAERAAAQTAAGEAEHALVSARAAEDAWRSYGGGQMRAVAEQALSELGLPPPASVAAAQERLAALPPIAGTPAEWSARLRSAEEALALTRQGRALAEEQRAAADRRRADLGDVETEGLRLHAALDDADAAVAAAEADVAHRATELGLVDAPSAIAEAQERQVAEDARLGAALAGVEARRQSLQERRAHLAARQRDHAGMVAWLAQASTGGHEARLSELDEQGTRLRDAIAALRAGIALDCQALGLAPDLPTILTERGAVASALRAQEEILAGRGDTLARLADLDAEADGIAADTTTAWDALRATLPELDLAGVPDVTAPTLAAVEARLSAVAQELNAVAGALKLSEIDQRLGALHSLIEDGAARVAALVQRRVALAQELGLDPEDGALAAALPPPSAEGLAAQGERLHTLGRARITLDDERDRLAQSLGLPPDALLDEADCDREVTERRREIAIKRQAGQIAETVRRRMIVKVLPQTTENMRHLLPLLTLDRYHDCEITDDYKLLIYDETAGRTVAKNVFSGGARDQFSLALRLAFALATLPESRGTSPGFIFLDEPLSSFDGPRSDALVNLLTRGQIHGNFSQIVVISHNLLFDRAAFTHHLRLEGGAVVESTLPQP